MTPLPTQWLPPRARRALNRQLAARNAFDRALAAGRGLAPDDPACARFQGPGYHDTLDHVLRKRRRGGCPYPPSPAMAAGIWAGLDAKAGAP